MEEISNEILDVVIVGGGHAGLSMSYLLTTKGLKHLVFERSRIGETWQSQRWNSFRLNTANYLNMLPGQTYTGYDPEGYSPAENFIDALIAYKNEFQLPVIEHSEVVSVDKIHGDDYFTVSTLQNGVLNHYYSKQIVIASGGQNVKQIPLQSDRIPKSVLQLHTCEYKSPSQLPLGGILVVSSAQSGCQIAEDLADAGKTVFLSTSRVGRYPRRYRGKDIIEWLLMMNFYDFKTEEVTDPKMLSTRVPVVSGIGNFGHSLSLQSLAKKGVTILGRLEHADAERVYFMDNADEHVRYADEVSNKTKIQVDEFILNNNITAPEAIEDTADLPDLDARCTSSITSLDLLEKNINTIIWATGFKGDFSYIKLPIMNQEGQLSQKNGISDITGLYYLGLPWQRRRKSAIVFGIQDDAEFILENIFKNYQLLPTK